MPESNGLKMSRAISMLSRMHWLLTEGDWPSNRPEWYCLEAEVKQLLARSA